MAEDELLVDVADMTVDRAAAVFLISLVGAACGPDISTELDAAPTAAMTSPLTTLPDAAARPDLERAPASEAGALFAVLYSEHDAEVRSLREGVVEHLAAELGDAVGEGAVLGALNRGEEEAAVASTRAALELARAQHERATELVAGELISRAELEEARYRLRASEAAAREAEVRLEQRLIRAPFAGVVSRRHVRLGQWVAEGEPLYRVTALRPLRAQLRLPETEAARVSRGARVLLRSVDGSTAEARVARVAPIVDAASGTVEVLLEIPRPDGLRPGSTVAVELPGGDADAGSTDSDARTIPANR